jgi:hypothetical protein
MMTAYLFIAWGLQPIGAVLGGVMAEAWGTEWVFVMSGVGVGSLFVLAAPMFRAVDTAMADAAVGGGRSERVSPPLHSDRRRP